MVLVKDGLALRLSPRLTQGLIKSHPKPAANGKSGGDAKKDDPAREAIKSNTHTKKPAETFTSADNKKIMSMKKEGKTWKEILATLKKDSESQLRAHWKANLQAKFEEQKKKDQEKEERAKKKKEEGLKRAEEIRKQRAEKGKVKKEDVKEKMEVAQKVCLLLVLMFIVQIVQLPKHLY